MVFRFLILSSLIWLSACSNYDPELVARLSTKEAKHLFGAVERGSKQRPAPHGSYAKGCVAGAEQLAATGPTWQAMRLSRNRNWGLPIAFDFIQDLSAKAARQSGWNGLYIGDISQPRGGPMLTGHASHQIGLDIDIWMRPADDLVLSTKQREEISSISMRRANGAYVNDKWTKQHHNIIKAAASDPRTARIFVFPGAKVQMCKDEKGDRAWLNKVRPGGDTIIIFMYAYPVQRVPQIAKIRRHPPGDGCKDAERWVRDILIPAPKSQCTKTETQTTPDIGATSTAMCWCFAVELSGLVILSNDFKRVSFPNGNRVSEHLR